MKERSGGLLAMMSPEDLKKCFNDFVGDLTKLKKNRWIIGAPGSPMAVITEREIGR